ncbi:tetratricopeptide repeat protein [Clostridium sp. CF012]|uniref:tetratricopeptide repeat protein n=1 Tax=Clostridium sp. CF012 TaxID=2843319 RepID=UPI001C0ACD51|nr:tetratricopeptide repeat protein [Clostridium sp. CF012]MBU3145143.1 helix-turn-helix transcriptional regulator [Clostridium sp. CF012]
MKDTVEIFGKELEYDFLSGWIKYNRLHNEISQSALAYGICSISHLSYFENGKKTLRGEIIELLLKKLNIHQIEEFGNIGLIRQQFYNMMFQIENLNHEDAKTIYKELLNVEDLISTSPYNIEYKIYQLMYNTFVECINYNDLKQDIIALDKIYSSLSQELQYLYLFITGRIIYKYDNHNKGIERLVNACKLKETPWINYNLGFSYCFNNEQLKGTYYLEKALESYEKSGRYINALWCHNYIGICYTDLKIYEKAEKHFKAALTGAEHFNINKIFGHLYINLSYLNFCREMYEESIVWTKKALETDGDPLLCASNYVEACIKLKRIEECKEIFNTYLIKEYEYSIYYNLLRFFYLSIFHLEESIFYEEVTKKILPYYENINYYNLCKPIKLKLIEHLEKKRKYKEANRIYKELV